MISQSSAPLPVRGFHGTTRQAANAILQDRFRISQNPYDWLGDGVYFFQDGLERAWEWARVKHGIEAAVIGAEILLDDCLDMLSTRWTRIVSDVYDQFLSNAKQLGLSLPNQTSGAHRLDREVINYAVGVLGEQGITISCVRASFWEGRPIYPDSAFYDYGHIQIAVRDVPACIRGMWLETTKYNGGFHGET